MARTNPRPRSISRDAAELEGVVRQVAVGQRLQQPTRFRAHHGNHRHRPRNVGDRDELVAGDVPTHPRQIAWHGGRCRQHQELGFSEAGHGDIGLDPTEPVEPLGVHDAADGNIDVCGADALQQGEPVAALHQELPIGGDVEHTDRFAHGPMFRGCVLEPVLTAVRILVPAVDAVRCIPVGPFPTDQLAEHRAACGRAVVQRAATQRPRALALVEGPVHVVGDVECLLHPLLEEAPVRLVRHDARRIGLGQVDRRAPVDEPIGQHRADAGPREEPGRVEARGDVEVLQVRGLTEVIHPIGREALRTTEEQPNACGGQRR